MGLHKPSGLEFLRNRTRFLKFILLHCAQSEAESLLGIVEEVLLPSNSPLDTWLHCAGNTILT